MWFDFIDSDTAYEPTIWSIDWINYALGQLDTPWDDHFADITLPVLMVTPAGGFGLEAVEHGLSLLGSTDVQILLPGIAGPPELDFAHVDLFTAPEAVELFYDPLVAWIDSRYSHEVMTKEEIAESLER